MTRDRTARWKRSWDKNAPSYDREMGFWDRHLFKDSRAWVCGRASGDVLEVAVGTGLNLPHYPDGVRLTGVDISPAMLAVARGRADDLGREVDLREADAGRLELPDQRFDTVVCTFGLCAIPDDAGALAEMVRVLKPSGRLVLADHVCATSRTVRGLQRALDLGSVPMRGEHFRRRPAALVERLPLRIEHRERFGPVGIVERLVAVRLPDRPS